MGTLSILEEIAANPGLIALRHLLDKQKEK
jgi:hypothetical protein